MKSQLQLFKLPQDSNSASAHSFATQVSLGCVYLQMTPYQLRMALDTGAIVGIVESCLQCHRSFLQYEEPNVLRDAMNLIPFKYNEVSEDNSLSRTVLSSAKAGYARPLSALLRSKTACLGYQFVSSTGSRIFIPDKDLV